MQPSYTLNTTHADQFVLKYDELTFTLLGGIRLEGLDRMRVTVKAEFRDIAIRHNLDLYNDSQSEKLGRKCAERFGVGEAYMTKAIGELVSQLEQYRLSELKKQPSADGEKQKIAVSEAEQQAAINFLQQPDLLNRTSKAIGRSGLIGEEKTVDGQRIAVGEIDGEGLPAGDRRDGQA